MGYTTLVTADLALPVFRRGKVRDTFILDDGTLLMVASDRISAFDVVLPTMIPKKGLVLTQIAKWWFAKTGDICPNHLLDDVEGVIAPDIWRDISGRSMHCRKADRIEIECVVRGYLSGSGWKEYRESGTLAGETLPAGLKDSSKLPELRFTPATKNDTGHDVNISRAELANTVGTELARQLEETSLALFAFAAAHCEAQGIILADTKFEFGWIDGRLHLIDEIFTPDSSRFWSAAEWCEGAPAISFDKQPVRDYLETLTWDKKAPGPVLPPDVVAATTQRYVTAAELLCGIKL